MSDLDAIPVDSTTAPWWDATREQRLVIQQCATCQHLQHYPRALCTACGSTELGWLDVSGDATVDSYTVVHRALPGFEPPYVVARVRLAEGPILVTNLMGSDVEAWSCGDNVTVTWKPLDDGRNLPVFAAVKG